MEDIKMKTYLIITVLSIFILAGCSSTKSTADYDDVYYPTSKKKDKKNKDTYETQTADPDYYTKSENDGNDNHLEDYATGEYVEYEEEPYYSTSETIETPEGTTYVTNNYYSDGYMYDDYYDYSYASRIRRFYNPYGGFGYYSPYYTGYYYDPWYWGPSFSFGFSWGWGSIGWGWGYPYYYYPWNNYWYGYNCCCWNGYYPYPSPYYDYNYNNYYYGHRPSRGSSNSGSSGTNGSNSQNIERYSHASTLERTTPQLPGSGTATRSTADPQPGKLTRSDSQTNDSKITRQTGGNDASVASGNLSRTGSEKKPQSDVTKRTQKPADSKQRYTYKKPANTKSESKTRYNPGESYAGNNQAQRSKPAQKYNKPNSYTSQKNVKTNRQNTNTTKRNTQTYTKPKSNYERSYNKPTKYNTSRSNSQPSRSSARTYSQPSRSSSKSYSQPSRSSKSYSPPTRSGNSKSYSSPSRSSSSRSYSSPSRSSSSSSSRSSGGSRSSGSSRGRR